MQERHAFSSLVSSVHTHTESLQGLENWIYLQQQKQGCKKKGTRRNGGGERMRKSLHLCSQRQKMGVQFR